MPCPPPDCADKLGRMSSYSPSSRSSSSSTSDSRAQSRASRSVLAPPSPFLNLNHITLTYLFRASSIIARTSNSQAPRSVLVPSSLPFSTPPTPPPRSLPGRPQQFLVWLPRFAGHLGVTFTSKYCGALLHPRSKLIGSF